MQRFITIQIYLIMLHMLETNRSMKLKIAMYFNKMVKSGMFSLKEIYADNEIGKKIS